MNSHEKQHWQFVCCRRMCLHRIAWCEQTGIEFSSRSLGVCTQSISWCIDGCQKIILIRRFLIGMLKEQRNQTKWFWSRTTCGIAGYDEQLCRYRSFRSTFETGTKPFTDNLRRNRSFVWAHHFVTENLWAATSSQLLISSLNLQWTGREFGLHYSTDNPASTLPKKKALNMISSRSSLRDKIFSVSKGYFQRPGVGSIPAIRCNGIRFMRTM